MKLNIGVMFGGKSAEHELSIVSAVEVMGLLNENKYNITPIYLDKENNFYTGNHLKDLINYRDIAVVKRYLKRVGVVRTGKRVALQSLGFIKKDLKVLDVIIPIGHGPFMEDGSLQGFLNLLNIPYIGSNVLAGSLGQDKVIFKKVLEASKLPTPNYIWFYKNEYLDKKKSLLEKINNLKYPVFVKPASLGAGVGITKVKDKKDLSSAVETALKFDNKILIEEEVSSVNEINLCVFGNSEKQEVLEFDKINQKAEDIPPLRAKAFFVIKKNVEVSFENCKKPIISKEMLEDMKTYAKDIFRIIGASGIAKIKFLIDDEKKRVYISEINTNPHGLSGYLYLKKKKDQAELVEKLIELAIDDFNKRNDLTYTFKDNLLEDFDKVEL